MNQWFPLRKRRIIRSLTCADIAVEPSDPVNAPTHCTDAPSVHPVLKQNFWRVSVWFKCKRRIDSCQCVRSSSAKEVEPWPLLLPNPRSPGSSVHLTVCFENWNHRTHPTNVETKASVHPTLWLELQLIQFNLLWVFHRLFCFYFASMITLSWLTSTELECAYFNVFWCMVKLLVHEPLLIVRSNTTN
jgi:hypothetical protein